MLSFPRQAKNTRWGVYTFDDIAGNPCHSLSHTKSRYLAIDRRSEVGYIYRKYSLFLNEDIHGWSKQSYFNR